MFCSFGENHSEVETLECHCEVTVVLRAPRSVQDVTHRNNLVTWSMVSAGLVTVWPTVDGSAKISWSLPPCKYAKHYKMVIS